MSERNQQVRYEAFADWFVTRLRLGQVSLSQIARHLDVSHQSVSKWATGRAIPGPENRRKLAVYFNVPEEHLARLAGHLSGAVQPIPPAALPPEEALRALQGYLLDAPIMVPEVEGSASAGFGSVVESQRWPYWPAPEERGDDFIAVPVVGDCLEPLLMPGQRAIVNVKRQPADGDICLAYQGDEALLKILKEVDGEWWLVALHEDYPPIKVNSAIRITGVVRMAVNRPEFTPEVMSQLYARIRAIEEQ